MFILSVENIKIIRFTISNCEEVNLKFVRSIICFEQGKLSQKYKNINADLRNYQAIMQYIVQ